jgi:hypothetical protein
MPYLSEWHHELEDGNVQIWVQCNDSDAEGIKPQWVRLGDLMERVWASQPSWWSKLKLQTGDFVPDSLFVHMRNKEKE